MLSLGTEKVNSKNISRLSIEALSGIFNKESLPSLSEFPSLSEVIESTIKKYKDRLKTLIRNSKEYRKTADNIKKFQEYMNKKAPTGFEYKVILANIDRNKKTLQQNKKAREEYNDKVHKNFIKFAINKHEQGLLKKGYSKYIIHLMKKGIIPQKVFKSNVDHIFEISLSNKFGLSSSKDPLNPYTKENVIDVNKFANLAIISKKIHDLKNFINDIQYSIAPQNKPFFLITLVPKYNPDIKQQFIASTQDNKSNILSDEQVISLYIQHIKNTTFGKRPQEIYLETLTCISDYLKEAIKNKTSKSHIKELSHFYKRTKLEELKEIISSKANLSNNASISITLKEVKKTIKTIEKVEEFLAKSGFPLNKKDQKKYIPPRKGSKKSIKTITQKTKKQRALEYIRNKNNKMGNLILSIQSPSSNNQKTKEIKSLYSTYKSTLNSYVFKELVDTKNKPELAEIQETLKDTRNLLLEHGYQKEKLEIPTINQNNETVCNKNTEDKKESTKNPPKIKLSRKKKKKKKLILKNQL